MEEHTESLGAVHSAVNGQVRRLPVFRLSDAQLGMGASLGNGAVWINTKNTGAIERIFSCKVGESLIGAVTLRYGIMAVPVAANHLSHRRHSDAAFIGLRPDGPRREFEIHPGYQRVSYTMAGVIAVNETTFVPLSGDDTVNDRSVVYQIVRLKNNDRVPHQLRMIAFARLRGSTSADIESAYEANLGALVSWNRSEPNLVRIFGLSALPTRYSTTFDFGAAYDPSHVHPLDSKSDATGDVLGALQIDIELAGGQSYDVTVKSGVYVDGPVSAIAQYDDIPEAESALAGTVKHLEDRLRRSEVITPDDVINQAAMWSKVNMRRVMASYRGGPAFTNDPGVSSAVVIRDASWFVYGNDYFMPDFSRVLLEKIADIQYASGKLPEFYDAVTGHIEDDGLNINDDTPLYILAVHHHFKITGDIEWLRKMYSSIAAAAEYIVSQMDVRGLVFCSARDPRGNVWGIASWRNIIPLYTINGAVTEINAECVAALRESAQMAAQVGRYEDVKKFEDQAERIRMAMDEHLINPDNGLYYLNIDVDGNAHTDVTGDEVFPVMFSACSDETAFRIISRLNAPDFWTSAGLRTASRNDPLYEPSKYSGLLGGVWPGLTWWYAFAAARYHPEFMVRALRSSFAHYAVDPKKNNTVPGQFSEWFDGESLTNKGMRLSPWEPPRFLWAVIEGVCGFTLTQKVPKIVPLIPENWSWIGLRRVPFKGAEYSYFSARVENILHVYSTAEIANDTGVELYDDDVSDRIGVFADGAIAVALERKDETAILLGNTTDNTLNVSVGLSSLLDTSRQYELRIYDSERRGWEEFEPSFGGEIGTVALSVDAKGFRLLKIRGL